jgi:hypothetical protein
MRHSVVLAFLFCVGKLLAKHRFMTPCYPSGMEIFLAVTLIAILIVLITDTRQKRHTFLCQQEVTSKKH